MYRDKGILQVAASFTCYTWMGIGKKRKGVKKSCKHVEYSAVWKANNYFVKDLPAFCGT